MGSPLSRLSAQCWQIVSSSWQNCECCPEVWGYIHMGRKQFVVDSAANSAADQRQKPRQIWSQICRRFHLKGDIRNLNWLADFVTSPDGKSAALLPPVNIPYHKMWLKTSMRSAWSKVSAGLLNLLTWTWILSCTRSTTIHHWRLSMAPHNCRRPCPFSHPWPHSNLICVFVHAALGKFRGKMYLPNVFPKIVCCVTHSPVRS